MRLRDIHTVSVQKLESTRVVVCAYYSVCSALGADMFDCVYPSRTARFGTALIPEVGQATPHIIFHSLANLAHNLIFASGSSSPENSCDGIRLSSHRQRVRLHGMHAIQPCAPTCKNYEGAVPQNGLYFTCHEQNTQEPNAASLLTYHNIRYQMRLCEQMHQVTYPTSKHVNDASTASVGFSSVAFQNESPGLTMSDGNR